MYQFAIDMGEENGYTPAAPKGAKCPRSSLKTEQLAISQRPVLGSWYLVLGEALRPSAFLGLVLGLGGAWVALGPPKGHPRVAQAWRKGGFA
jgi:hypothetical protein